MLKILFLVKIINYFDLVMYLLTHFIYVKIGYYTSKCLLMFYVYTKLYLSIMFLTHFVLIVLTNSVIYSKVYNVKYLYFKVFNKITISNVLISDDFSSPFSLLYNLLVFSFSICIPMLKLDGMDEIFLSTYLPPNDLCYKIYIM